MRATFNVLFLIKSEIELMVLIILTIRNYLLRKNRIIYLFLDFFLFIIIIISLALTKRKY